MLKELDPMRDPVTRNLLRLAAERLSVGYLIAEDTDQCDRWTRLVGVLSEPPAEAMADA